MFRKFGKKSITHDNPAFTHYHSLSCMIDDHSVHALSHIIMHDHELLSILAEQSLEWPFDRIDNSTPAAAIQTGMQSIAQRVPS